MNYKSTYFFLLSVQFICCDPTMSTRVEPAEIPINSETTNNLDQEELSETFAEEERNEECLTSGNFECPFQINELPFQDMRDTNEAESNRDYYDCAPETYEAGGEFVYEIFLSEAGILSARLDDIRGDLVDVDVHILESDQETCLKRHNAQLQIILDPGRYYVVVDTWMNAEKLLLAGRYRLQVQFNLLSTLSEQCAMNNEPLLMWWDQCSENVPCFEIPWGPEDRLQRFLEMPALGSVVKEAHLVSEQEFEGWPSGSTDGIERHFSLSEAATDYRYERTEPWAPAGEGGSLWGQGSTGMPVPLEAEAWYITMFWRHRPPPSTRMLVFNPVNGRAVVAAAGYETGPGSNEDIGGVSEEIHHYLNTQHQDLLQLGFLLDQTLPFGPINCTEEN